MGISVAILGIVISFTNLIVGKLIIGGKRKKVTETDGKSIYIIGMIAITIIGFGSLFTLDILDNNVMKWYWLGLLTLVLGFHTFVDWKYMKETKDYIVSLICLMVGIIYILIFIF